MIQNPGGIGVDSVFRHQQFGETRHQLGGSVFARMDRAGNEDGRFRTRNGQVGQAQYIHVVTAKTVGLFPGIADIGPTGEIGVVQYDVFGGGEGFLDRAITGESGDADETQRRALLCLNLAAGRGVDLIQLRAFFLRGQALKFEPLGRGGVLVDRHRNAQLVLELEQTFDFAALLLQYQIPEIVFRLARFVSFGNAVGDADIGKVNPDDDFVVCPVGG